MKLLRKCITIQWIQESCKNRMDTIFTNSENSKTSESHGLLLNLAGKINW